MAKETEWTKPIRERFTQYRNERPSIRSYGNAELDRMLDDAFVVIFVGCAVIEAQAEAIEKLEANQNQSLPVCSICGKPRERLAVLFDTHIDCKAPKEKG